MDKLPNDASVRANGCIVNRLLVAATCAFFIAGCGGDTTGLPESTDRRKAGDIPDYVPADARAMIEAVTNDVKKGDELWADGKKDKAVEAYTAVLNSSLTWHVRSDLSRVYGRVIDYKIEQADTATAKKLILQALESNLVVSLNAPGASELLAEARVIHEASKLATRNGATSNRRTGSASSSGASFAKNEMEAKYKALVNQVRPGMSSARVTSILGQPTKVEPQEFNGKRFEIWTWNGSDNSNSFIMLNMENGVVTSGGTPGYDIKTGFKATLPKGLSPSERQRREKAAKALGIKVE